MPWKPWKPWKPGFRVAVFASTPSFRSRGSMPSPLDEGGGLPIPCAISSAEQFPDFLGGCRRQLEASEHLRNGRVVVRLDVPPNAIFVHRPPSGSSG